MVAGVEDSAHLYAFGAVETKVNIVHADRNTPGFMRSPPVVPYIYALESAMDEMAVKLDIDPVEFRRINDTMTSPIDGKPYSSRSLMKCYDQAAEAFGWKRRDPRPGSMRDGEWLVGWGCATALYPTHIGVATARVRLMPNGDVRVQTAAHEIGNGVYTVLGPDGGGTAWRRLSAGDGRGRRFRPAAGAGRGRLQYHRERLQRGDEGLRCHPRQAVPCGRRRPTTGRSRDATWTT